MSEGDAPILDYADARPSRLRRFFRLSLVIIAIATIPFATAILGEWLAPKIYQATAYLEFDRLTPDAAATGASLTAEANAAPTRPPTVTVRDIPAQRLIVITSRAGSADAAIYDVNRFADQLVLAPHVSNATLTVVQQPIRPTFPLRNRVALAIGWCAGMLAAGCAIMLYQRSANPFHR